MENPFRYGGVATGRYFADRETELAELTADMRGGQNVVIISPRRYGKTSLVFEAIDRVKHERVLIAYLDLFRTPTKERFADLLAAALHQGLVAPVERILQRAIDVFQHLPARPRVTINPDGTPSFEFASGEHARDLDQTIERLLELPGRVARDRKRRVALVLDEFQEVLGIDPHLPAVMRAVFQMQPEVAHVFLGSRQHLMRRVFTDENEPLYRLARPLPLGPIPNDEFAAFIRDRFAATRIAITDEAVTRVLGITGGHPHDTQELCYFVWAIARGEGVPATPDVVSRGLERVLDAEHARYITLWEAITPHQRLVLIALVREAGAVYSEAFRRRHRLGAASSVQRSLTSLVDRDLVEFTPPAAYQIPDPFFRNWIARFMTGSG
ncbi:MAG: ATP-binding protein [Chloroflexi bacterium]|nr:ATP-binding protein [Chloroflexota bacterium]